MNLLLLWLGMLFLLAIILGCIVLLCYLSYREAITQAERGLAPLDTAKRQPLMRWGTAITLLGLVLLHDLMEKD